MTDIPSAVEQLSRATQRSYYTKDRVNELQIAFSRLASAAGMSQGQLNSILKTKSDEWNDSTSEQKVGPGNFYPPAFKERLIAELEAFDGH
ncbi:MAG: hypothetical protein AAGA44_12095 [Pseudomonadota bacterium]